MIPNGKLVAIEGIDRAGKSSIVKCLANSLANATVPITLCGELHSPCASLLRKMLKEGSSPFLKTYLFASDRAWEYEKKGQPALMRGELVLWDRYVDSAIVYRTVEFEQVPSCIDIDFVRFINSPFPVPDLSIYIDVSPSTSLQRSRPKSTREPYDSTFLKEARACYLELATKRNYRVVNGERPLDAVAGEVGTIIREDFKELFS